MRGKTIKIYLVDGVPTGILAAEIMNWTGKVFVAPRSQLADLAKREDARRTGVYGLVGADPESPNRDRVYIGEGDNVLARVASYDRGDTKDFWTRTVLVVSKDENLTKAHVRYLESRLIQMAREARRGNLANETAPPAPSLPESDLADMEFFLQQVQMILPVLGFSFLQPIPSVSTDAEAPPEAQGPKRSPVFVLKGPGAEARAQEISGEFVVMAGSLARRQGTESWVSYRAQREQLRDEGVLVESDNPDSYRFASHTPFPSPSAASNVVLARQSNGRTEWKVESTGHTYAEWQEARLPEEGAGTSGQALT